MYLMAFAVAAAVSLYATPLVRKFALKVRMLDAVDERRMNADPKPRVGGLAVFLGFSLALFVTLGFGLAMPTVVRDAHDPEHIAVLRRVLGLFFGGTLILLVGVWDDVMGMRPSSKLFAQIAVALVSMAYGYRIDGIELPHTGTWLDFPPFLEIPITLLWYVGMMNAINFLDGLDGLLAGTTVISGFFLFVIAVGHGHILAAILLAALVGGVAGFLPYNFNPSKIILGDTGSLFIGYLLATISILITAKGAVLVSLAVPLVTLALPVLDTAMAIVRRTLAGQRITQADRGHIHHLLVFRFGLSVRQAVLLIYAVSFVLGAVAYVLSGGRLGTLIPLGIFVL
jgi:UDP-GlcNAc:undecaprenyl-phosphate GlcNAc-1-phosphate transferase